MKANNRIMLRALVGVALGALVIMVSSIATAWAQDAVRIRGTIERLDGSTYVIKARDGGTDLSEAVAGSVGWDRLAAGVAEAERMARPDKTDLPALDARAWPVLHRLGRRGEHAGVAMYGVKDMNYAVGEGKRHGVPLSTVGPVLELYGQAIAGGHGEEDFSVVVEPLRKR